MSAASSIEWTDATWNPVTGCSRVSPGCAHCYALELAPRLRAMGSAKYQRARDGGKGSGPAFGVTLHEDELGAPLRWRKPRMVFVNSMSDLFHEEVPDAFIGRVFATMILASRHTFQVLTKRPERMRDLLAGDEFWGEHVARALDAHGYDSNDFLEISCRRADNVWLGVSIENRRYVGRADVLRETPAAVRFISAEPLLGPLIAPARIATATTARSADGSMGRTTVDPIWGDGYQGAELALGRIDWLIVGGESGSTHRRIDVAWVRDLRDACACPLCGWDRSDACDFCSTRLYRSPAFFFKQWGGRTPKAGGRKLDGRTWDEMPVRRGVAP